MEKNVGTATRNKFVIVTGPESTGKTLIAQELSHHFNAFFVEEYAREYISNLTQQYTFNDVERIATNQRMQFKNFQQSNINNIFIFDTWLIITKIWFKWVYGNFPEWIDEEIRKSTECLYLLCATDIDWIPDLVRENGGEARDKLFEEYKRELELNNLNYKIIKGQGRERLDNAVNIVKLYLENE